MALGGPKLFSPKAKFIQVDIHASELGNTRQLELGICAGLKSTLAALNNTIGNHPWPARKQWLQRQRGLRDEWMAEVMSKAGDTASPLHPAAFFAELRPHLPDCLYSWDGGDFVHWGRVMLPATRPGGWMRLGPMATIGAGLPNAVGLQIAHPNERVLMVTGDGSLGFYIAELDTLVRHNLPVVIIVGNDAGWGVERELQSAIQGTTVACELRRTRYDLVMKGFGGKAENITRLDQVGPAIQRAFASGRPYLLNVNARPARSPFTEWAIQRKAG
jgi:acetolactate synthase-1/2/3 large subunit